MRTKTLVQHLASLIQARYNCQVSKNEEWFRRHSDRIVELAREFLPSGSGIDNGTQIDIGASTAEKIVLQTAFHHMNADGFYDGWTYHTITVKPAFDGVNLTIRGKNRNDIKDHLGEQFEWALTQTIVEDETGFKAVA